MEAKACDSDSRSRPPSWRQTRSKFTLEWQRLKHHARMLHSWWLKSHRPYQPLFVIATCRTGSNLLLDYLRQQPSIQMLPEVLWWGAQYGPRSANLSAKQAVQHIRYSLQTMRAPIRGCKLMLYQLDNYGVTLEDLKAAFPEGKYIVLYRESLAHQFVSQEIALQTRQWALRPGQERREATVTIAPASLRQYCESIRQSYRAVLAHRWLPSAGVLLSYEELTSNPGDCLHNRIGPLLNVDMVEPKTRMFKQNARTFEETVANYDEVASMLHSPMCRQKYVWPARQPLQRLKVA